MKPFKIFGIVEFLGFLGFLSFINVFVLAEIPGTISLSKLNVHLDGVTVSGFSAGGSMANQMHVAHSKLISGIAIFSQVFYRCGPNSLVEFGLRCSKTGYGIFPYKLKNALADARQYESQGLIDPLINLGLNRIFIWTGSLDEYIPTDMAVQNADFYKNFSSNPQELISLNVFRAKHLLPTKNFGNACDEDASENVYLGNCNYSGAYHALSHLLHNKTTILPPPPSNQQTLAPLLTYNQSEFYHGGPYIKAVAMGTLGFIYIPTRCQNEQKCFLHVNFHGCNEWIPEVAQRYIENSGFLPVAEMNNIILVFPLTTKVPQNMDGCWDFFSYTGPLFATNQGAQVKVARAIIQRILYGI